MITARARTGKMGTELVMGFDLTDLKYDGSMTMNSIGFFDLPAISMGITRPKRPQLEEMAIMDEKRNIYKKFVLENNQLVGMIAIGDVNNCGVFLRLIKEGIDISSIKDELIQGTFNYASILDLLKQKDKVYIV